ncbi:hypothetical protein GCM10009105_31030 [Dokdonella soli]|uniref:Uncharacterized protein n=2 Tax=Dokdonella soli TaxID=529810 RepID=A0ABP3TZ10_9GAMM
MACAAIAAQVAVADPASPPGADAPKPSPAAARALQVHGGAAAISFNPDALAALALNVGEVNGASARTPGQPGVRYDASTFAALGDSTLEILQRGSAIVGIGEGELRFRGGFVLAYPGGAADLRGFALRGGAGVRLGIDLVNARGTAWLSADHAHYGFGKDDPREFSMREMNLRLAPHFAQVLGHPELTGSAIGTLEFHASADANEHAETGATCRAPWPAAGLVTDIEVFNSNLSGFWDSVYAPRCGLPPLPNGGACTATSTNGKLVLGADASLRNIGKTAIPWYGHFSGNHPPYGNDQHPFLIWNLYRVDSAGRIKQIGASGVKHAFYSINKDCGCAAGNVFWPGCEDIYSFSSNDNGGGITEQNLAPRSEIIPYGATWGRCGSVWDADCDGKMDAGSGAQDLYQYRMQVTESDLLAPLSVAAQYFFEFWYIVRDDANIYNTMGYRQIQPRKNGANWSVGLVNANAPDRDFFLGPAINRWVDPSASPAMNRELATPLGRARVAVKATDLGDGRWRYEYAVMNFDYAHAYIDPAHATTPDLKLLSNHGFARFSVPLPAGVSATELRFDDADGDSGNDWIGAAGGGAVTWTAPAAGNTLDWGTLYHFEFVANAAPVAGSAITLVGAASPGEGELSYALVLSGPGRRSNSTLPGHSTE